MNPPCVEGCIVPCTTFKEPFPFHAWNHTADSVANHIVVALDTWTLIPHLAKILMLLVQTSWARRQLHKQCAMSSKLTTQALQSIMPPLFISHSPVGTTRWMINQKNTLTLSGRDEFHILLLVLSTKTKSTTSWAHLLAHFSLCKDTFLSKCVEYSKKPINVSCSPLHLYYVGSHCKHSSNLPPTTYEIQSSSTSSTNGFTFHLLLSPATILIGNQIVPITVTMPSRWR